jgi:putative Ca2+/H+ antiporter (TMEM165/GDT1 family)
MGDKTQLLTLVLIMRFARPWTIMAGVLVATIINHALAAWAGDFVASLFAPEIFNMILAAIFFIFAGWILIPDKEGELTAKNGYGVFLTTVMAFFLAEMGDKTQLATIALAAHFHSIWAVTIGSTAGMMAANGLAALFGQKVMTAVPMKWIRVAASALFVLFGVMILLRGWRAA